MNNREQHNLIEELGPNKIKIAWPTHSELFSFKSPIPVTISSINYGGHAGHDALITLMHEARIQFLESLHLSEGDVDGEMKTKSEDKPSFKLGIILANLQVDYKKEVFRGQTLLAEVLPGVPSGTRWTLWQRLWIKDLDKNGPPMIAVEACFNFAFFDYEERRLAKAPESLIKRILNLHHLN